MNIFLSECKKVVTDSNTLLKYVKFAWCEFFLAIAYNLFLVPNHLVTGGSGGIAIILQSTFGVEPSLVIYIFCFAMFLLAWIFLETEQILPTLFVSIIYPFFIDISSEFSNFISYDENSILLFVIFGAITTGFFQGQILKIGLNFGGINVLAKVIYKYTNISVTLTNAFINAIIVIVGGLVIGPIVVLYAVLFLIILRTISEKVVLGSSQNKTFKIITKEYKLVENFIEKELGHDVIIYDTYGAHDGGKKKLIMSVIPTKDYILLRDYVKSVDKKCFIFITDTYALEGEDRKASKEKC